jgi:hypothetical protein
MSLTDKILNLTRQLYPTGRAFKMPFDGYFEKLHKGLAESEVQAYSDAVAIHYSILPDNENFTTDDATDWERRLGLINNPSASLSDRKLAIKLKLNQPGINPAKSNYKYLESQLQAAGFSVYVYENRFPLYPDGYETQTPIEVSGDLSLLQPVQHGDFQHGDIQHGSVFTNKIVNHIDELKDLYFDLGGSYRASFFIGGSPLGSTATVPLIRKNEFRQLILKNKPVQNVGFLFIQYT